MPANDRIPIVYVLDQVDAKTKTAPVRRKKGDGDQLIEDKVVAQYDPEKGIITFPNMAYLRNYKEGVTTFLAENELTIRSFQRADIRPDKSLNDKNVPPRPKKDRLQGDKTPEVVDWYMKYRWNEFCARYGYISKYTGPVRFQEPVWTVRHGENPKDRNAIKEYQGARWVEKDVTDAIVTTRKTHLTFTPDECTNWSEDDAGDETESDAGAGVTQRSGRDEE